jgi:hypothetical protein
MATRWCRHGYEWHAIAHGCELRVWRNGHLDRWDVRVSDAHGALQWRTWRSSEIAAKRAATGLAKEAIARRLAAPGARA